MKWYAYMIKCQNGAIYTGITHNIERRFKERYLGKGGHYTDYNRLEKFLHKESLKDRQEVEQREKQIKRWSRVKKVALIKSNFKRLVNLSKSRS